MHFASETVLMAATGSHCSQARTVNIAMIEQYVVEPQHRDKMGLARQGKFIAAGMPNQTTRQIKTKDREDAFLALSRGQEA